MSAAITDFYIKMRSGGGVTLTNDEAEGLYSVLLQQQQSFSAQLAEVERLAAERDELRRRVAELIHYPDCWDTVAYPELKNALDNIDADYQGCTECAEKSMRRIKAEAVRDACDKVVSDYRAVSFDKNENLYLNIIALRDYANQIEGGE